MPDQEEHMRSQMVDLIRGYLDNRKRLNTSKKSYWYPLNYATYDELEIASALESMVIFQTSMSTKVKQFERAFTEKVGSEAAVFCNSGSSADLLALKAAINSPAYDLEIGDKVLVPAITWPTHIWSIIESGLTPVLYDSSEKTFNPDITTVSKEILGNCKAVFTMHLLGTCADMDIVEDVCKDNSLLLFEDTCESLGAKYNGKYLGTYGLAGTFSGFFSHHITTMEGGILVSDSRDLISEAKLLRSHGWSRSLTEDELKSYERLHSIKLEEYNDIDSRYLFLGEGYNLRPTEINASFGIEQIKKMEEFNEKRKSLSTLFYDGIACLKNIHGPTVHAKCDPCFMALPLTQSSGIYRNIDIINMLEDEGVESRPLISGNIQKHPAAKRLCLESTGVLHGSDVHHRNSFYIGLSPVHTEEDIKSVLEVFRQIDKRL